MCRLSLAIRALPQRHPEQVVRAEQEKAEKYAALLRQLEESEARLKDL